MAFVNYRRADSSIAARWLAEKIQSAFGASSVFIDTDGIRTGDKWRNKIEKALAQSTVMIVVIGRNWLRVKDKHQRRRIDDPNDWVAKEIGYAISHNRLIIPVLISKALLPQPDALPKPLKSLPAHLAIELRDDRWEADVSLLLERLEHEHFVRSIPLIQAPAPPKSVVFDQQVSVITELTELVYRAETTAREITESLEHVESAKARESLETLSATHEQLIDLLYKRRAILPQHIFKVAHETKHELLGFRSSVTHYQARLRKERAKVRGKPEVIDPIITSHERLRKQLAKLVRVSQAYLGVESQPTP